MIWFACKQCGKVHGRSESSAGTTIFCDCGQGNVVPWESSAKEPEKGTEPALPAGSPVPAAPRLKPMVFDASPPPLPSRSNDGGGRAAPPQERRDRKGPRDPNACLNHDNRVKQNTCVDCGEGFCSLCVATFEGKVLCGPCKNFRVRLLQKPLRIAFASWFSVVLAVMLGPLAFCVLPIGQSSWSLLWTFLALIPQGVAIFLAVLAWRSIEKDPGLSGRGFALSGMVAGSLTVFLILLLNVYGSRWSG